jgi:cytochrome P450
LTYELAEVRRIVDEIIAERHSETVKQPAVDMLGLLLAARDAENASDRLSDSEVANQVLLFPLAGRETTAVRGIRPRAEAHNCDSRSSRRA